MITQNSGDDLRDLIAETPISLLRTVPYLNDVYRGVTRTSDAGAWLFAPPAGNVRSDHVYKDYSTTVTRDPREPGIAFKQVGSSFASPTFDAVLTDRDGYYVYFGSGESLSASAPAATWIATDPIFGGDEPVGFNGTTDFSFVDFTIRGRVFADVDANGVLDGNETPVAGRRVWIDADYDGAYDAGERTTTSDAILRVDFNAFSNRVGVPIGPRPDATRPNTNPVHLSQYSSTITSFGVPRTDFGPTTCTNRRPS